MPSLQNLRKLLRAGKLSNPSAEEAVEIPAGPWWNHFNFDAKGETYTWAWLLTGVDTGAVLNTELHDADGNLLRSRVLGNDGDLVSDHARLLRILRVYRAWAPRIQEQEAEWWYSGMTEGERGVAGRVGAPKGPAVMALMRVLRDASSQYIAQDARR